MKTVLMILVIIIFVFTNSYAQLTHTFTQKAHINDGGDAILVEVGTDGNVFLVGSNTLRAYNYDGSSFINTAFIDIPNEGFEDYYYDMEVSNDGIIFLTTGDSGLWAYSYDGSSLTNTAHFDKSFINIAVGSDETIFLVDSEGLYAFSYDGSSFTNTAYTNIGGGPDEEGNLIAVGSDGTVFVIADSLRAFTYDGSSFTNTAHIQGGGYSVAVGTDVTVFVTDGDEIHQCCPGYLEAYSYDGSSFTNTVYIEARGNNPKLAVNPDGTIFRTNGIGCLWAFTYDDTSFTNTAQINDGGYVKDVAVGLDGTVFIANEGGLFAYEYSLATAIADEFTQMPKKFVLSQNYPNPFNPSTNIEFNLPKASDVRIEIYNTTGQKIQTLVNKKLSAGSHQVEFNAQNLSSGVYFYRIEAGEFQDVKKMILIK